MGRILRMSTDFFSLCLGVFAFFSLPFPSLRWALLETVDNAVYAVFDQALSKVDDQSQLESREPQIGERLRLKDRVVFSGRFTLDDNQLVY